MAVLLLQLNLIGLILSALTFWFVQRDRAFSKKIRTEFQLVAVLAFYVALVNNLFNLGNASKLEYLQKLEFYNSIFVKAVIVCIMVHIYMQIKKNTDDTVFVTVMAFLFVLSNITESKLQLVNHSNGILCVIVALFYCYFVMQNYKKDGLTKLLLRHDLHFEMEDMHDKVYDVVLIDVDNFKLINDKYGHEKGDEVLINIATTIKNHLPKKCRAYRYGGDEFIVISTNEDTSVIEKAFEEINSELMEKELHISYGISRHNPGEWGKDTVADADAKMYENKKILKSDKIWDDMTGLFNFRGFLDELEGFRTSVSKDGHIVCLVAVDIDRLNNINMAYGYAEGNIAITALARVIKSCLSGRDFIGHLGSDEFAIAIECNDNQDEKVLSFINDVSDRFASAYEFASKDFSLKINVGKYYIPKDDSLTVEELVNSVLYAKQSDKDDRRKTGLDYNENDYDKEEEKVVMDILDNNKLKYAFQPIVSAKDGEIVAYEALMRSDTEQKISPLKILNYADRNNRLYDVEKYTFFNVLEKVSKADFIKDGRRVFINSIPGIRFKDYDYNLIKTKYSHFVERLVVEITEQRELDDEALSEINYRRSADGFNIAIDDYGSGHSNTNSLLRYMPEIVKLDRLLITGIDRNAKKQFFVNSIISFARENDMMILAEGVETENELKTVIRLGVDMIQGFFTAKPSYDVIDSISAETKKIIVDENIKASGNQRMVYTVASDCELSVVHLAMEDYTKINISAENVSLIGNSEYTSDMIIRIKENVKCNLTLSDVKLNSVDDEPCIDIGENSDVTICVEGDNKLNFKGIHVPESSKLTIKGAGDLSIYSKGIDCYAIGDNSESKFGDIVVRNSGKMYINVDGEKCIGIGGGVVGDNSKISILMGEVIIKVAGIEAIGVGCLNGCVPIIIKDCSINSDFRVNRGTVIGAFDGKLDISAENFAIQIDGSGTEVCGIGCISKGDGCVSFNSGSYDVKLNGQKIYLLGCNEGGFDIKVKHTRVGLLGEGNNVLGFGSFGKEAKLYSNESHLDVVINASSPLGFGLAERPVMSDSMHSIKINGEEIEP